MFSRLTALKPIRFAPIGNAEPVALTGIVSKSWMLIVALVVFAAHEPVLARDDTFILNDDVSACDSDPRYRVGGAAMGECLLHRSRRLDRSIKALIASERARFCSVDDRKSIDEAQRAFEAYREAQCAILERSPGNTSSYVNAAACTLLLGRYRREELRLMTDYAKPHCPPPAE